MNQYALVYRPVDIGTIPRGVPYSVAPRPAPGQPHHDMARHGILVTDRPLTVDELKAFELAPLAEGEVLEQLALAVAQSMGRYASAYLGKKVEDPELFSETVLERVAKVGDGVRYSIADAQAFVDLVAVRLKEMANMPAA